MNAHAVDDETKRNETKQWGGEEEKERKKKHPSPLTVNLPSYTTMTQSARQFITVVLGGCEKVRDW